MSDSLQQWLTLGLAVLGAVLGVLNTWDGLRSRRVRLQVTPRWSMAPNWTGLSIEVINLSSFPVTIREVGFTLDRSRKRLPRRVPIPNHAIVNDATYPSTLQPREVLDLVFSVEWVGSLHLRAAYAITSSGEIARGTSGALEQFIRRGNKTI